MTSPRYPVMIGRAPLTARFEIVGNTRDLPAALIAAGLPVPTTPSTRTTSAGRVRVAWIGPRRMIIVAAIDERARLASALRASVRTGSAVVVADVTGATTSFVLKGRGIDAVLAQGFAHDLSSLADGPDRLLATDGWGTAAILEHFDGGMTLTVDASFADYVEHMLRSAAGLPTSSKPGVMRAPPPPIRTAG